MKIPSIPIVSPIAVLKQKDAGRTRPLEMRCETGKSPEDYIVKLWHNIDLGTHGLVREVYGSLLAQYFGISTPEIALVDIPPNFGNTHANQVIRNSINASPGLNFGSKYIRSAFLFTPPALNRHLPIGLRIFCFDMLIGNLDRAHPKINMFKTADTFIVFDHEQAFPFSRPAMLIGGFTDPSKFIMEDWPKRHILYSSLKGKDLALEIEEFISDLLMLDDSIFATIEAQIPPEWQAEDLKTISQFLAKVRDNATPFKRSLQELLA